MVWTQESSGKMLICGENTLLEFEAPSATFHIYWEISICI